MGWLILIVILAVVGLNWFIAQSKKPIQQASVMPAEVEDSSSGEWLKFEFDGAPLSRISDGYTLYTAKRFKDHCIEQLAPHKEAVVKAGGVVTVNIKRGLKTVDLRASDLPDELIATICEIVRHVQPPYEEGELEYRAMERRNAKQRYMRSIGRWKS
jgi:hypothetical protein